MKPIRKKSFALALAGMIALPSLSHALPPLLKVTIFNGGTSPLTNDAETSAGYLSRSLAGTNGSGGGSAESQTAATFGVLRAKTEVRQVGSAPFGAPASLVTATYRDNRITNAPGRAGQSGFVTVKFRIDGTLLIDAPPGPNPNQQHFARAKFELSITGGASGGLTKQQGIYANGQPYNCDSCAEFLNIEQTHTYAVTFGSPYDFELLIHALAELKSYSGFPGGRVLSDLGSTATWGGIVAVTDANGNPVTDYTDTSVSGANYVGPIVPQCATPPGALAGWWPGDNNPRDIEGGNDATLENGASYAAGRVGQAFSFPTAGARVHVPHAGALDFNATQDYTIDFWMKAGPQTGSGTLVEKNGGTYPYSVQLLPTGFVTAAFTDGTSPTSVTSTGTPGKVNDQLWHHIAVVFKHSAQVLEIYVDGSLNASQTYTATLGPLANGQDVYFGARSDSSNSLNGFIDEVDISTGALSLAEIQAIVAAADLGKCRAPVVATGAVSRKTHGGAGDFDVNLPLTGTPGIECRSGGTTGDYQIVVTFADAVDVTGSPQAELTAGIGDIGSGGVANGGVVTTNGSVVTIPLTNVTNVQNLVVSLLGVSNGPSTADVTIPMGVLVGDTTGERSVTGSDISQVKASSGRTVTNLNFRLDVNTSGGSISASDISLVKSVSGRQLPPIDPEAAKAQPGRR